MRLVRKPWGTLAILTMIIVFASLTGCGGGSSDATTNDTGSNTTDQNATTNPSNNENASQNTATSQTSDKPLVFVWYPNESGEDLKGAREAIGAVIEKATGRKVEHKLTTDYNIAIEAIASGQADLSFTGAQGYIAAHNRNPKVMPMFVSSGESGTLDDAVYYSWFNVLPENAGMWQKDGKYTIDPMVGKRMSFVSNNSTSGFKVPSSVIIEHFKNDPQWKDLTAEDLMEGGKGKFFSEVMFGGSHQGSAVNLLTNKADVAAFCDGCVANYVELKEGEANRPGAVYKVRDDAADPFTNLKGKEFVVISVTPVLNAPFSVNTDKVDQATIDKLIEVFTSDEVANNEDIFIPKGSEKKGLFSKKSGKERFVPVDDSWFNPIRELSN